MVRRYHQGMAITHVPEQQAADDTIQQKTPAEEQAKVEWLRQALQVGLDDIEHGRYVELNSPEEIKAHLAKLLA